MNKDRNIKLLFGIVFFLILVIPNVIMMTTTSNQKFPLLSFDSPVESINKFNKYYSNNLGLKSELLDTYLTFKSKTLNEAPLRNKVLEGKDGWYFLGNNSRNLFDDSFGNYSFSKSELEKISKTIKTIRDTLASKGIAFHIVVPPNKHRVYSEKLPYKLNHSPTRLEELKTFLENEIDFEILDLRDTLIASKEKELLYYKTNTHWNDLGAYIAYRKTLNHLDLGVPFDSISNYESEIKPIKRGDITDMVNLPFNENALFLNNKYDTNHLEVLKNKRHILHFKNHLRNKKIVLYRDSFANFWIKHFNQSFGETIYFRGYNINYRYIFNQKPNVVVIEVVERNLSHILLRL